MVCGCDSKFVVMADFESPTDLKFNRVTTRAQQTTGRRAGQASVSHFRQNATTTHLDTTPTDLAGTECRSVTDTKVPMFCGDSVRHPGLAPRCVFRAPLGAPRFR